MLDFLMRVWTSWCFLKSSPVLFRLWYWIGNMSDVFSPSLFITFIFRITVWYLDQRLWEILREVKTLVSCPIWTMQTFLNPPLKRIMNPSNSTDEELNWSGEYCNLSIINAPKYQSDWLGTWNKQTAATELSSTKTRKLSHSILQISMMLCSRSASLELDWPSKRYTGPSDDRSRPCCCLSKRAARR